MLGPPRYVALDRGLVVGLCAGVAGLTMVSAAVLDRQPAALPLSSASTWHARQEEATETAGNRLVEMTPLPQSPDIARALLAELLVPVSLQGGGLAAPSLERSTTEELAPLWQPARAAERRTSGDDPLDDAPPAHVATGAPHSWASPLYPQNGVTLWDRIRVSSKRDRRAYLLGTAIRIHAPATAAVPGPRQQPSSS